MAVTSRMPKEQRRAQVLEAARAAFTESGYYAVAMDDIAERAGVSKPVLYQHFASKLELYLALVAQALDALTEAIDTAATSTTDNRIRVRATVDAYFTFVDDPDRGARLAFQSDVLNEPAVRALVDRANDTIAHRIAEVIAADTGLRREQALVLAAGMAGMAEVSAQTWLADPHRIPREEAVELVFGLAWRGIRSFPLTYPADTGRLETGPLETGPLETGPADSRRTGQAREVAGPE